MSQEHQEELLLQEANHELSLVRRQIAEADALLESLADRVQHELRDGSTGAELHFDNECGVALLERRKVLEREAVQKEKLRLEKLDSFRAARRRREVVETLRQHQFQLYRQEENRQDQRQLDDLFLLRRNFLRRS